ncbi:MAG TPA: serpin family protein [Gemmataceae bacterium]|nr:serpin family protein [Gemmataceae bacterium]
MRLTIAAMLLTVCASVGRAADVDPPVDPTAVVKGDAAFALDLYAKLRTEDGNLFFAPHSISAALAMTRGGARGDTAAEMDRGLHFTLPQERLHAAFAALGRQINGDPADKKRGYQLSTANALWGQKGYGFSPDFLQLVRDNYGGGFRELDFAGATEEARQTVNAWVEQQTNDKIKELLQKGDLTGNTKLVLTNAIYFKGDWASRFKKDRTLDAPFHVAADKSVNVPLMNQEGSFRFFYGDNMEALELPYAGDELSMVLLLPHKIDGLADLEKALTPQNLDGWLGKLRKVDEVEVSIPRFKMTSRFELKDTLRDMGMPTAFSEASDFSGFTGGPNGLHIAHVIHKAYVDVNEEGAEAAAATAVVSDDSAPPQFRADHPFLFLIRNRRSGAILFLGRMTDPTK